MKISEGWKVNTHNVQKSVLISHSNKQPNKFCAYFYIPTFVFFFLKRDLQIVWASGPTKPGCSSAKWQILHDIYREILVISEKLRFSDPKTSLILNIPLSTIKDPTKSRESSRLDGFGKSELAGMSYNNYTNRKNKR